jgi:hypothetical protein
VLLRPVAQFALRPFRIRISNRFSNLRTVLGFVSPGLTPGSRSRQRILRSKPNISFRVTGTCVHCHRNNQTKTVAKSQKMNSLNVQIRRQNGRKGGTLLAANLSV